MESDHILKNAKAICDSFNKGITDFKLETCNDAGKLADFYKTYDGPKEFLYIAPKDEIEEALKNGAIYFVVKNGDQIVGVAKATKLNLPYPFFCVPASMDSSKDYWGLSGLYVHKAFRGKGLSSVLLKASTALAQKCAANGIYADFDYRNVKSMRLVSKYYNLLGYTDGRCGSPDEATIYTTFFKDFTNSSEKIEKLDIFFEQIYADIARGTLDFVMEGIGPNTINVVPYCGGHNEIVCFDKPYEFVQTNIKIVYDITEKCYTNKIVDKNK